MGIVLSSGLGKKYDFTFGDGAAIKVETTVTLDGAIKAQVSVGYVRFKFGYDIPSQTGTVFVGLGKSVKFKSGEVSGFAGFGLDENGNAYFRLTGTVKTPGNQINQSIDMKYELRGDDARWLISQVGTAYDWFVSVPKTSAVIPSSEISGGYTDRGDVIDFALQLQGVIIDLQNDQTPFAADLNGKIPTALGLDGTFPVNLLQASGLYVDVVSELNDPTDLAAFKLNRRELKDLEGAVGTDYSDFIVGADTVYRPDRSVDTDFRGYDLIGGGGNDTILIYKGNKDQVTFHKIDGGDGRDAIAINSAGKTEFVEPITGVIDRSAIYGGADDDVIFVLGAKGKALFGQIVEVRSWGSAPTVGDDET